MPQAPFGLSGYAALPEALYGLKKLQKIYLQGNPIDPTDRERLKKSFVNAEIVF